MSTHVANKGYLAIRPETTKGTPAGVPNIVVPIYSESFATDVGLDEDNPIIGNIFARFQTLLGKRSHGGEFQAMAEPNTLAHLFAMLMSRTGTSGSDPYTHAFEFSLTVNPKSYTVDVAKGQVVFRYAGVELSEMSNEYDESKMVVNATAGALKSFIVAEVASFANSSEITLKTNNGLDPAPTELLQVGDLVRIMKADGTYVDDVIDTVESGVRIDVEGTLTGVADGDLLFIRPSAVTAAIKTPFNWVRTEYRFGDDDTEALSASQVRMDEAGWTIMYEFEDEAGAQRSGSADPAELVRTQGNMEVELTKYFDDPRDFNRYKTNLKDQALVIRHFSETGYELRITVYKYAYNDYTPELESGEPVYSEFVLLPEYNSTAGKAIKVEIINALSSIV